MNSELINFELMNFELINPHTVLPVLPSEVEAFNKADTTEWIASQVRHLPEA